MTSTPEEIPRISLTGEMVVYYDRSNEAPKTAIVRRGLVREDTLLPVHGDRLELIVILPGDKRLVKAVIPLDRPALHIDDPNRHGDPLTNRPEDPRCWDYGDLTKRMLGATKWIEGEVKRQRNLARSGKDQKAEQARIAREAAAVGERERQAALQMAPSVPKPPQNPPGSAPATVPQTPVLQE